MNCIIAYRMKFCQLRSISPLLVRCFSSESGTGTFMYTCHLTNQQLEEVEKLKRVPNMTLKKKLSLLTAYRKETPEPDAKDISTNFIRGSGKGGSKRDHTSNCVQMVHNPTGVVVKSHDSRDQALNKRYAREKLLLALDDLYNGPVSKQKLKTLRVVEKGIKRAKNRKSSDDDGAEGEEVDHKDDAECATKNEDMTK